jgi:ABC-type sugar transport system permease subunit
MQRKEPGSFLCTITEGGGSMHRYSLDYKKQKIIIIIVFLIVPLAMLFTFSFLPLVRMLMYSFTDWNGLSRNIESVGWKNYSKVFSDPDYFSVFKVSLYYFGASFVQIALALYFSTILSFKLTGRNFFRGALFFPYLINGVAIGFIFKIFFRGDGTLDYFLTTLGLENWIQKWIANSKIINFSLAATSVWRYMGFNFIIFLGTIQSVPNELYEAAEIDGANRWHQFRYIIWPSIRRIIGLNLLLAINGSISVFEIPYIMTFGANGSTTYVIQTINTAFERNNFGLASAMGIILLGIVIIVALAQRLLFKDQEVETW